MMNGNKIIMKNIVQEKSFAFALDVIKVYKEMLKQNEYVISKQLVRSATSIGANVEEAQAAQTKKDFAAKMSIASKEARETKYWLRQTYDGEQTDCFRFFRFIKTVQ